MNAKLPSLERLAVRILAWMCAVLVVLFAVELAIDLSRTSTPWSALHASARSGQALASTVSRAFNNMTAMVLTFIALAVPLTANMHTPKLIEIFVRDKVNIAAMVFFAGMGAHAIFGQAVMYDQWEPAPVAVYSTLWISGVVGFAVLIPYYCYVLAFLNPTTIIRRVTDLVVVEFDAAESNKPTPEARRRLHQNILNLGNVILRAVDRADRDVSLDAIHGLQSAVIRYVDVKPRLPADWFEVESALFTGHSHDAIRYVVRDRIWVEQKCLHQLLIAYSASLSKMPDAISAISGVSRRIALYADGVGDERLLALCVRYVNTFLREAIRKKDVHAIYDVYSQYSFLAKELLVRRPQAALEIARHFRYYAQFARAQGMPFVCELAAYDVVELVESAYDADAATRREILDVFLAFDVDLASVRVVKAHALLAAYFEEKSLAADSALVVASLHRATPELIDQARREILATTDPVFWEVTDRQRNFDYVAPARRETVKRVLDAAALRKRDGAQ
jgi:hypothetical protein